MPYSNIVNRISYIIIPLYGVRISSLPQATWPAKALPSSCVASRGSVTAPRAMEAQGGPEDFVQKQMLFPNL